MAVACQPGGFWGGKRRYGADVDHIPAWEAIAQVEFLIAQQIKSIVSVRYALPDWVVRLYDKYGLELKRCPISGDDAPTVEACDELLDWVEKEMESDRRVAITCLHGLGRSGTIAAAYLIRHSGSTADSALRTVRQGVPGAVESQAQVRFLSTYEAWLTQKAAAPRDNGPVIPANDLDGPEARAEEVGIVCNICGAIDESQNGSDYPGIVCRACQRKSVNVVGLPAQVTGCDMGDNPVFIHGLKCWRRYRMGIDPTMLDLYGSANLTTFHERQLVGSGGKNLRSFYLIVGERGMSLGSFSWGASAPAELRTGDFLIFCTKGPYRTVAAGELVLGSERQLQLEMLRAYPADDFSKDFRFLSLPPRTRWDNLRRGIHRISPADVLRIRHCGGVPLYGYLLGLER